MIRHDSLPAWRDSVVRVLFKLDFKAVGTEPFWASVERILDVGDTRVFRHRHSPGFTYRDATMVKDAPNSQTLAFAPRGTMQFAHRKSSGRLASGEAILLSNSEPGELGAMRPLTFYSIVVQGERPDSSGIVARRWGAGNGHLSLLKNYVAMLAREGATHVAAPAAARHIEALVDCAAETESVRAERDPHDAPSIRNVRTAVAMEYLRNNFRDARLSPAQAANNQGISVRYLQRLFEDEHICLTKLVTDLRLAEVGRLLADPAARDMRIVDIAFAAGFSDLSHFNRIFRKRHGATPSAVRERLSRGKACETDE